MDINGWHAPARFFVVDSGCDIVGIDTFELFGFELRQRRQPQAPIQQVRETTNNPTNSQGKPLNFIHTHSDAERYFSWRYPDLFTRTGRANHHTVRTKFIKGFTPTHQKGRRVPLAIQTQVEAEIDRLQAEGHIIKLNSCTYDQFISPIVITVKRDKTVKLALDSRHLNKNIHKNKYQMPNIDELVDNVSQNITSNTSPNAKVRFTLLDLRYAYGELPLDLATSLQCNFNIVGGKATGTYRFLTGFYGLADMPAEFQQALDMLLHDLPHTHAFIDDILIVTTGSELDHLSAVSDVLDRLNNANLGLKLSKCTFLTTEADWLGYHIDSEGIAPLPHKTDAIAKLDIPTKPKQLKSFLGAINQLSRFIPNLAQNCDILRDLLK